MTGDNQPTNHRSWKSEYIIWVDNKRVRRCSIHRTCRAGRVILQQLSPTPPCCGYKEREGAPAPGSCEGPSFATMAGTTV
jgi:hypothetical protein